MALGVCALGMYMGHEDGAFMNRIGVLIKKLHRAPCLLLPHEDMVRSGQSATLKKASSRTQPGWRSLFGFLSSRTVRNKSPVLISHPVCCIFIPGDEADSEKHIVLDVYSAHYVGGSPTVLHLSVLWYFASCTCWWPLWVAKGYHEACCYRHLCKSSCVDMCFYSSWVDALNRAVGSYARTVFNFLRYCPTSFQSSCAIWHSSWQYVSVPVVSHLHQYVALSVF